MNRSFLLLLLLPLFSSAQFNNFTEKWKLDADFKNASLGFTVIDANTSKIISILSFPPIKKGASN